MEREACFSQALGFQSLPSGQGAAYGRDGATSFRMLAEQARAVAVQCDDRTYPLVRGADGAWTGTFVFAPGFHYVQVLLDGNLVLSPYLPIGFGYSRPCNYIDVPAPAEDFYALRDVPHGTVARRYFASATAGCTQSCLVYCPNGSEKATLPTLYLQHGLGENETGWVWQGRVERIMDNLLAEGRVAPMRIVMGNGMVLRQTPPDDGRAAAVPEPDREAFPELLVRDLIPFIDGAYPTVRDRNGRAVAGLSMGSMHASAAGLTHPELFSAIGLFSGFLRNIWKREQPHLARLDDPAAMARDYRVFFRAMGRADPFLNEFLADDRILADKGVRCTRVLYDGAHDWQVWRRCARDFLPLLFR